MTKEEKEGGEEKYGMIQEPNMGERGKGKGGMKKERMAGKTI